MLFQPLRYSLRHESNGNSSKMLLKMNEKKLSIAQCERLMDKIPTQIRLVMDQGSNHIYKD
jgi:hypothetical protein